MLSLGSDFAVESTRDVAELISLSSPLRVDDIAGDLLGSDGILRNRLLGGRTIVRSANRGISRHPAGDCQSDRLNTERGGDFEFQ